MTYNSEGRLTVGLFASRSEGNAYCSEERLTIAIGDYSCTTYGGYGLSEGYLSITQGRDSHTEGVCTIANRFVS